MAAADPADRQAMLQEILQQAKDGRYGEGVKAVAERLARRLAEMPVDLKADLAELLAAPAARAGRTAQADPATRRGRGVRRRSPAADP
ncbi:MAG: hypothetical protein QM286_08980 [Acidobacteriota bacterium]|nr:hypothetical protein [Acidobacteriota bacterium]